MTLRTAIKVTIGLGVVSLAALAVGHLALTDFRHGESDLRNEWRMLQVAGVVTFAFHLAALTILSQVIRRGTL